MDRLEALVAIAHRRLQLRRILVAIERNPQLLEAFDMAIDIRRPMELAGLKSRMERATRQERAIEVTGKRYDEVQDKIDELHDAARGHVGNLELQESTLRRQIEGMVANSNLPNDGAESSAASSGDSDEMVGQVITSKPAAAE